MNFSNLLLLWLLQLLQLTRSLRSLAITIGHCEKNISVKYQVPVVKTRLVTSPTYNSVRGESTINDDTEVYVDYEERLRWDIVQICCPGYRTIIFGLCEAICTQECPRHSHCVEPNKCQCSRGFEPSHHPNKEHNLICRPTCPGGCPDHSHCISPSVCECRLGFRDVSTWFNAMRCERLPCGPEQRYDVATRGCVRIEMSMEELMQKVGQRLAHGLQSGAISDEEEERMQDEKLEEEQDSRSVKKLA